MSAIELKVHPPIVMLVCALMAWIISRVFIHPPMANTFVLLLVAMIVLGIGILLATLAVLEFRRYDTTIEPTKPEDTSHLVTGGVYKITRNPMYLALLLVLSSWTIFLGNVFAAPILLIFVIYITRFQIRPEERIMASKFGEAYAIYCRKVRRWI